MKRDDQMRRHQVNNLKSEPRPQIASDAKQLSLSGVFLIAMPSLGDTRFQNSVVYLCEHSKKGAMGLIVNKPSGDVKFVQLLEQLEIKPKVKLPHIPVYFGGPVETGRGFVLHSGDYKSDLRTLQVEPNVALTPTLDVLEDIAAGQGPRDVMMMLGYSGWGPGQLEREIAENSWLTVKADPKLLFHVSAPRKWAEAVRLLGVDPALLSACGGRA
jgi:putative transcriptional regulator